MANTNGRRRSFLKATGITRKIDELGRIVLPIELRRQFDIDCKDSIDIYTEDDKIILKKYEPACIFCGEANGISQYKGKNICPDCAKQIANM